MTRTQASTEGTEGTKMKSRRRAGIATLALALALAGAAFGAAPAGAVLVHDFDFPGGGSGSAAGQFAGSPTGIAINHASGDVYVADPGNHRIQQFDADGDFIRMWGLDVVATGEPNDNGAGFEVCDTTAGNVPGDCKAGVAGDSEGALDSPSGIAIDNSGGAADGSVYVQDRGNFRIQRFTAEGAFVLMWGKDVNSGTGNPDVCTDAGAPTDVCGAGAAAGAQPGGFGDSGIDWFAANVATDGAGSVYVANGRWENPYGRVQKFDATGSRLGELSDAPLPGSNGNNAIQGSTALVVDAAGSVYSAGNNNGTGGSDAVRKFSPDDFSLTGNTASFDAVFLQGLQAQQVAIDPSNQHLFAIGSQEGRPCRTAAGEEGGWVAEIRTSTGQQLDCTPSTTAGIDELDIGGAAVSPDHKLYAIVYTGGSPPNSQIRVFDVPAAGPPAVGSQAPKNIVTGGARIEAEVTGNLADTTAHLQYGTEGPCSDPGNACVESDAVNAGAALAPIVRSIQLNGLQPATTYHFRAVAESPEGTTFGADQTFTTYPAQVFDPTCENNLARQQTGAAYLLDCRAYELVSAENQGGYNVTSNLIAGQEPFMAFPEAQGRALYSVKDGGIPGTGKPTNRGADPYIATRDPDNQRWSTSYVGVPADASGAPFSSTLAGADDSLGSFAFSGPDLCDPCLADGSSGIPVRTPGGALIQGMAGSLPVPLPEPAGGVKKHFSADGTHFLFASEQQFEPAANPDDGNVTIYARNLATNTTEVVSTMPNGSTIAAGDDVRALDVSADGSRVLIGVLNHTDTEGNEHYDLYLHEAGNPNSTELVSGGAGALYAGMTKDGSQVLFTSTANLDDDTDASADLFRATIDGGVAIERVSTGTSGAGDTDACDPAGNSFNPSDWNAVPGAPQDCSVVAVGGQGGLAAETGVAYFLSPEALDGSGVAGAPNLFRAAPGEGPELVATLESGANAALPAATHSLIGDFGSFPANPNAVALDAQDGSVYVQDIGTATGTFPGTGAIVRKFDAQGNVDAGFGGGGTIDGSESGREFFGNTNASGVPAGVPAQLAVDNYPASPNYGNLLVADTAANNGGTHVKMFDPAGNYISTPVVIAAGAFDFPTTIAVDPTTGNIYLGQRNIFGLNSIRVYTPAGAFVSSFGVAGPPLGIALAGGGVAVVAVGSRTDFFVGGGFAGTIYPNPSYGVAIDPSDGHIFINEGDRIREYTGALAPVGSPFGLGELDDSVGVVANGGLVYAADPGAGTVFSFGTYRVVADPAYDHPLVINSVADASTRHPADFQANASGEHAAFASTLEPSGFDSGGRYQVFRHSGAGLDCASCSPTGLAPAGDSRLPTHGLGITDDGRVFFNSREALVMRDQNKLLDAYEWSEAAGRAELISSGSHNTASGMLGVSADGTDAFFFTRETLASNDQNGNLMKLYTARENGGFFVVAPEPPCAASDECHGPGSAAPEPIDLGTLAGSGGNFEAPQKKACDASRLGRRARSFSRRANAQRRRANRLMRRARAIGNNRGVARKAGRLRRGSRRNSQAARKVASAAKRCRAQAAARRGR